MPLNTENLQHQLTRSEEWGKNADAKVGIILAFDGVVMITMAKHALTNILNVATPKPVVALYILVLITLIWSIAKALWGITPRLKHHQNHRSLLYYFDAQTLNLSAYKQQLGGMTAAEYREELILQIHAMANVVTRKMVCFKDSVLLLAVSLAFMGGAEIWLRLINFVKA